MGNRLAVRVSCDDTPIFFVSALLLMDYGQTGSNPKWTINVSTLSELLRGNGGAQRGEDRAEQVG